MTTPTPILSERFLKALNLAFKVHTNQTRKAGGKNKSYFGTHLMAVCSYVQEVGGNEDEAIAAVLHDSVEDQLPLMLFELCQVPRNVSDTWDEITKRNTVQDGLTKEFGMNVASMVMALSDEKLPADWKNTPKEFRQKWLRESIEDKAKKLRKVSDSVRLVKACDVLHNMRSLLQDRTENGPALWKSFAMGCEGTLWKMEILTEVFEEMGPAIPAIELRKTLNWLKEVSKDDLNLKISK